MNVLFYQLSFLVVLFFYFYFFLEDARKREITTCIPTLLKIKNFLGSLFFPLKFFFDCLQSYFWVKKNDLLTWLITVKQPIIRGSVYALSLSLSLSLYIYIYIIITIKINFIQHWNSWSSPMDVGYCRTS